MISNENDYDLKNLIFSNKGGVKRIVFHSFSTSILGITTVETSGIDLGQHTYLNGGITPFLENDEFGLSIDDPDVESMFMIRGYDFIPIWFWVAYFSLVTIITLIVTFIASTIITKYNVKNWKCPLLSVSMTVTFLLLGMWINNTLSYITYDFFFLNWIIVFLVCNVINCLTKHYAGTILGTFVLLSWYCINYFVILFRSKPVMPSDLYAIQTAGEVMGGYNLVPTPLMIFSFILWLGLSISLVRISLKDKKKVSFRNRAIGIVISVVLFTLCLNNPIYKQLNTFVWNAKLLDDFYSEGMVLSFTRSFFSSFVREPEGYSRKKVEEYIEHYRKSEDEQLANEKPSRIIMIMNEAYSDLRDSGMTGKVDVQPFIDSMDENTLHGTMYASVYGGGTCNTEFEALTGNSLAFFPSGSYPYSQHIKHNLWSLAEYFKEDGFKTASFHPGGKDSWNRNNVYTLLGFDKYYSRDEYKDIEYLHLLPDDQSNYRFIESVDDEEKVPEFFFNVTYQNHSGYETFEDVPKNESAMLIPTTDAQVYLSLVAKSDEAVEELIKHYQNSDEKTMIIFFGDHQPGLGVENDFYIFNNNVGGLNKYKTEMFIWTNYDSEQVENYQLSANFLPLLILERAGYKLPPYLKMMKDVYEKYPVITSQGVLDNEGRLYAGVNDLSDDPLIQMYQYVQYANMFDNIDEAWFKID
ncbi:LTA synthase family protein [Oribacterium sp. KHPX15]|uniref:LTA synthase family protein n=1 Tax=Oribacterium sp. KHPX15 TaxID=1855342 RepID=UPI0015877536|nr:LTA synthase family protein [Oribacterium sp. KHPX15]